MHRGGRGLARGHADGGPGSQLSSPARRLAVRLPGRRRRAERAPDGDERRGDAAGTVDPGGRADRPHAAAAHLAKPSPVGAQGGGDRPLGRARRAPRNDAPGRRALRGSLQRSGKGVAARLAARVRPRRRHGAVRGLRRHRRGASWHTFPTPALEDPRGDGPWHRPRRPSHLRGGPGRNPARHALPPDPQTRLPNRAALPGTAVRRSSCRVEGRARRVTLRGSCGPGRKRRYRHGHSHGALCGRLRGHDLGAASRRARRPRGGPGRGCG